MGRSSKNWVPMARRLGRKIWDTKNVCLTLCSLKSLASAWEPNPHCRDPFMAPPARKEGPAGLPHEGLLGQACDFHLPSSASNITLIPLSRQNTCPCCRKEVKRRKMVQVNKLRKTIGRLQVKVAQSIHSRPPSRCGWRGAKRSLLSEPRMGSRS